MTDGFGGRSEIDAAMPWVLGHLEAAFLKATTPRSFGLYVRESFKPDRQGNTLVIWGKDAITREEEVIGVCRESDRCWFVGMLLDEMKALRS